MSTSWIWPEHDEGRRRGEIVEGTGVDAERKVETEWVDGLVQAASLSISIRSLGTVYFDLVASSHETILRRRRPQNSPYPSHLQDDDFEPNVHRATHRALPIHTARKPADARCN